MLWTSRAVRGCTVRWQEDKHKRLCQKDDLQIARLSHHVGLCGCSSLVPAQEEDIGPAMPCSFAAAAPGAAAAPSSRPNSASPHASHGKQSIGVATGAPGLRAAPAAAGRLAGGRCRAAVQARAQQAASAAAPAASLQSGTTLLWYKRDLRLDDHPGWHQALAAGSAPAPPSVVPVFCFDPARYAHLVLPPGGAEGE